MFSIFKNKKKEEKIEIKDVFDSNFVDTLSKFDLDILKLYYPIVLDVKIHDEKFESFNLSNEMIDLLNDSKLIVQYYLSKKYNYLDKFLYFIKEKKNLNDISSKIDFAELETFFNHSLEDNKFSLPKILTEFDYSFDLKKEEIIRYVLGKNWFKSEKDLNRSIKFFYIFALFETKLLEKKGEISFTLIENFAFDLEKFKIF